MLPESNIYLPSNNKILYSTQRRAHMHICILSFSKYGFTLYYVATNTHAGNTKLKCFCYFISKSPYIYRLRS